MQSPSYAFQTQIPTNTMKERKGASKKEEPPAEPVLEPHEHDVLCGRGGLTNHHPGNAWYRRLVRSNRPLYRESPKHTKLLVAKAIVHHVQAQNPPGRFLECKRSSGMWFPVSYKRAVDKTSQALREKDRENEGIADNKLLDNMKKPVQPKGLGVGGVGLEVSNSNNNSNSGGNQINMQQQFPLVNNLNNLAPPPAAPPKLETSSSWFGRSAKRQKTLDDPLPPTLNQRVSSMFKFFINSNLSDPDQRNQMSQPNQLAQSPYASLGNKTHPGNQMLQAQTGNLNGQMSQSFNNNLLGKRSSGGLMDDDFSNQNHGVSTGTTGRKRPREEPGIDGNDAGAPLLTRLSSQVSDWLQPFWPLHVEESRQKQKTYEEQQKFIQIQQEQLRQQQAQLLAMQQQLQHNADLLRKQANQSNTGFNNFDMNNTSTMPSGGMDLGMNNLNNNNVGTGGGGMNFSQDVSSSGSDNNTMGSAMTATEIQRQMKQIQRQNSFNATGVGDSSSAPPILKPSVSSSIFQLARSPSKLLTGLSSSLSSFFERKASAVVKLEEDNKMDTPRTGNTSITNPSDSTSIDDNKLPSSSDKTLDMDGNEKEKDKFLMPPTISSNNSGGMVPPPSMSRGLGDSNSSPLGNGNVGSRPKFGKQASRSLLEEDDDD